MSITVKAPSAPLCAAQGARNPLPGVPGTPRAIVKVNPGHPTTPTEAAAQHRFTLIWHGWLAGVAVTFGILETHALITGGEGATLTAHLRRSLGVSPRRRYRPAGRGLLLAVFGWLVAHLVFGVWPSEGWLDRPGQPDGAAAGGNR